MIHEGATFMYSIKEKSWSVRLTFGHVLNGRVRSEYCGNCDSIAKLIIGNNDNSNLVLYGCAAKKCRHVLLRVNFSLDGPQNFPTTEQAPSFQTINEVFPAQKL